MTERSDNREAESDRPSAVELPSDAAAAAPRSRSMLVVDDSQLVLEVIREFFVSNGYRVEQAEDAESALEQLDHGRPDVIVSDVLMPGMDGWAFFETVRDREELADVPFVFLTTEAKLPERLRGLGIGADDYMTKPFDVEELHARIEAILSRRIDAVRERHEDGAFLTGSMEHLALPDLLQVLSLNGTDGVVVLAQGSHRGRVVLSEGKIVHAQCDAVSGKKALFRMLDWATASFRLLPPRGALPVATIDAPTANLIMDGLVSLDEWRRWCRVLPPRTARIARTAEARARLEDLSAVEREVVNVAADGTELAELLETIPRPDSQIAGAVVECLKRGTLRTVE